MARSVADASLLGLAGLLLVVGGLLHPALPPDEAAQRAALPGDPLWTASHWVLTVGQALAVAGVVALARAARPPTRLRDSLLWSGATLAASGFAVGVLGTLGAATVLPEAARQGLAVFAVANEGVLGLGRLCMLLVGLGSALLGASLAPDARWFGWGTALAGVLAVASVVVFPPHHPWTHDVVLRAGAVAGGVLLWAAAWRVR